MESKNVILAIPCLLRGGTEIQTLQLAKALISAGHRVTVICYFEFAETVKTDFENSGAIVRLMRLERKITPFRLIMLLRQAFISLKPDVVHVQYLAPGALPIIAARLAGIKLVFATVHQPCTASHGRLAKLILRCSSLLTTNFVSVSLNTERSWFGSASLFNELTGRQYNKHHFTIYNSIDTEKIQQIASLVQVVETRTRLGINTGTKIIGAVSRLRHEKGIDLLVNSYAKLIKRGFDVHLLIVGSGPDEMKLNNLIRENCLSERVTLYGETEWDEAMKLMAIMDIVVVPSRFEGFGLTAAEAMAFGKPVVASDSYGLKEVVIDTKTGLIFKNGDSAALAEKLALLISDPGLRMNFSESGKLRSVATFGNRIFRDKITILYE